MVLPAFSISAMIFVLKKLNIFCIINMCLAVLRQSNIEKERRKRIWKKEKQDENALPFFSLV